ncbi:MAG: MiaB/RimO family radical SAM methylthiotransferase [Candidatus Margulisiibacteriota bacterium]
MKYHFVSLGCPKNLADTEVMMGSVAAGGNELTANPAEAEIIVVNTCAFLKPAREEALKVLREMVAWKKKGRCRKVYVAGCLPQWLKEVGNVRLPAIDGEVDSIGLFNCAAPRLKATPKWFAYVKIAEGCDNRCSYCLIPTIRGKLRLRTEKDILGEVAGLAKRGAKEIIFIAQDTTAHPAFPSILKQAARIPGIRWLRVMYTHPSHLTDELIETIAGEKKIVKYLDMPVQHASSTILKKMNRHYDRDSLALLLTKLRGAIPKLVLRTSLIVGFPGETGEDFEELLDFIKTNRFEKLGIFGYSREEGTPAAKFPKQVPARTKEKRRESAMLAQQQVSLELNRTLVGQKIEVLVEGKKGRYYIGRTYRDAPEIDGVFYLKSSRKITPGRIVTALITKASAYDLYGRLLA